jgi:regulator of protease activity HflC (stomatin/prohibitin superfamily)
MLIVAAVVAVFVLVALSKMLVVVPEGSVFVVERLGVYRATLRPGLHFLTPFVDRVAHRHPMTPRAQEITDHAISRDNVPLSLTIAFRWAIADAQLATYAAADLPAFVQGVVRSQLREWVAGRSGDEVRESTRQLEADVARAVTAATESAGIRIEEVTVQRIERA